MPEEASLNLLPLFPLGTALFPGGYLPLRIFEVRYLDMVRRCHKQGTPFGVVSLTQGSEVQRPASEGPRGDAYADEAFNPVGTLATITTLETPQAGLIVIRCTGTQRFKVSRSEKLKHGLWMADVALLPQDQTVVVPPDLQPVSDALGGVVRRLQAQGLTADELPLHAPYQLDDCGWVANRWCELLSLPGDLKQSLLALDNPLLRLELVGDLLARNGITG